MKLTTNNIPTLRVPEFVGEWERKKLGEVAAFSKGKGISKADIIEDGETECVRYGELYTFYGETIKEIKSRTSIEVKDLVLSEVNDVIIPASGETQIDIATASCVLKKSVALGGDLNIIKSKINGIFLSYYLNSCKKQEIANLAQGISVVHLYASQLQGLTINYPLSTINSDEQTKIANFLTAIDERIVNLKTKKQLLQQYKKGVMQGLFASASFSEQSPLPSASLRQRSSSSTDIAQLRSESESAGRCLSEAEDSGQTQFRFKQDNDTDFPDWEMKKFSNYIKLYRGSSPRPINKYITKSVSGVNWIKIGDMKSVEDNLINQVSEKIILEGALHSRKVDIGELILANSMSFGKTYLLNISGYIYDGWFVLREYEKHYEKHFLLQLLNSEYLQKQYKVLSTGGVVQNISSEIVYSTNLLKPTLAEQTKIAIFLSAIDEKINVTEIQIKQTQAWKKGLLQKMFV